MSEEIESLKKQFAERLVYHVVPLFMMNLAGLGLDGPQIRVIIDAFMEAMKEDSEIMKETARGKSEG